MGTTSWPLIAISTLAAPVPGGAVQSTLVLETNITEAALSLPNRQANKGDAMNPAPFT